MPEAPAAPSSAQEPALALAREWIEVPARVPDLELSLGPHFVRRPAGRVAPPVSALRASLQRVKLPARSLPVANRCCPPSALDRRREQISERSRARRSVLRALRFLQSGAASVSQHDRNLN